MRLLAWVSWTFITEKPTCPWACLWLCLLFVPHGWWSRTNKKCEASDFRSGKHATYEPLFSNDSPPNHLKIDDQQMGQWCQSCSRWCKISCCGQNNSHHSHRGSTWQNGWPVNAKGWRLHGCQLGSKIWGRIPRYSKWQDQQTLIHSTQPTQQWYHQNHF